MLIKRVSSLTIALCLALGSLLADQSNQSQSGSYAPCGAQCVCGCCQGESCNCNPPVPGGPTRCQTPRRYYRNHPRGFYRQNYQCSQNYQDYWRDYWQQYWQQYYANCNSQCNTCNGPCYSLEAPALPCGDSCQYGEQSEEDDCNNHIHTGEYNYAPDPAYIDNYWDDAAFAAQFGLPGTWLPEDPCLFRPFIADPRQVTFSVGWRWNDQVLVKNVIDVSYGDNLALYRWYNVWPWCGELQIEIEGALWACFDPLHESAPLINADYYVGFPLTYRVGPWGFRLRPFHISSHVGDEFLLNHPGFERRNPSAEYIDFAISYELTDDLRIYDMIGYVIAYDDSFKMKPWYFEMGLEYRPRELGFTDLRNQIYGEPFFGMDFQFNDHMEHHVSQTYVLGYEFGKLDGLRRRVRVFLEYHDGYSVEGQFSRFATNYLSFRMSYGF